MDIDPVPSTSQNPAGFAPSTAQSVAGPSSQPEIPAVFLPSPVPATRPSPLNSTQDLISRFKLLSAYDKYVRYNNIAGESSSARTPAAVGTPGGAAQAPTPGALDKGKGREVPVGMAAQTPKGDTGDGGDGDDDEVTGKGEKKKKNSYKHLIKSIPGKHSTKKDDYLQTVMMVPPKQQLAITKLDQKTLRDGFSIGLEGLKGWNINALIAESAQAREDRKKRKELRKLAKAQASGLSGTAPVISTPTPGASGPSTAVVAPSPTPRLAQTPLSAATPRPGLVSSQRTGSQLPGPGPGPPTNGSGPRPPVPRPTASAAASTPRATPPAISPTPSLASDPFVIKRGKKRELEDGGVPATNGQGVGVERQPRPPGAPTGPPRPRPLKKPKIDVGLSSIAGAGSSMPQKMPQQQPTPQGV